MEFATYLPNNFPVRSAAQLSIHAMFFLTFANLMTSTFQTLLTSWNTRAPQDKMEFHQTFLLNAPRLFADRYDRTSTIHFRKVFFPSARRNPSCSPFSRKETNGVFRTTVVWAHSVQDLKYLKWNVSGRKNVQFTRPRRVYSGRSTSTSLVQFTSIFLQFIETGVQVDSVVHQPEISFR